MSDKQNCDDCVKCRPVIVCLQYVMERCFMQLVPEGLNSFNQDEEVGLDRTF